ncbi:CoA-binding protein [Marinobacter sp. M3C]|uniref:CoA-binding protein n=1 Tax=Marinobacter sp. M3C TaxID=2917715 RepID=UPI00200BE596|nr:CoA-binding protein [Marinobacter sp. M3C]UQG58888.1 CoA-binding protein [Marinobacter sp. M3C]
MLEMSDSQILEILQQVRTIALVGASEKTNRPSHEVMHYLQQQGYRVIPVNPRLAGQQLLGETVYADLESLPVAVDMADLFLAPHRTDAVIDQAIAMNIPVLWLQIGVINHQGAERARQAGIKVVMDRCPKMEIPRLMPRP